MADLKTYMTWLWGMQTQVAQQMGFDLQYAPVQERITLLTGDVAGAVVLGQLVAAGLTTDADIQAALEAAAGAGWAEQAVPAVDPNNPNPPLVL